MSNFNKSTLTDHATTENHIIDWEGAKILDKETNRRTRQIKKGPLDPEDNEANKQRRGQLRAGSRVRRRHASVVLKNSA